MALPTFIMSIWGTVYYEEGKSRPFCVAHSAGWICLRHGYFPSRNENRVAGYCSPSSFGGSSGSGLQPLRQYQRRIRRNARKHPATKTPIADHPMSRSIPVIFSPCLDYIRFRPFGVLCDILLDDCADMQVKDACGMVHTIGSDTLDCWEPCYEKVKTCFLVRDVVISHRRSPAQYAIFHFRGAASWLRGNIGAPSSMLAMNPLGIVYKVVGALFPGQVGRRRVSHGHNR
jgi:hypothetical protein